MFRFTSLAIHLWLIWAITAQAQEIPRPDIGYLWPTDASRFLTSVFGESRARRYHTGIDIKTWGRVGYNVFAIRSGYVWKVNVSPYGYGKALYLKLDTGEVAVYAHLSGFAEKIQARVDVEQQRRGRYRVEVNFSPYDFPVLAGDVIAFTGQTGIGAPHLHFEIRDSENNTTNPLLKGYQLGDAISPVITKISFTPLDGESDVNGDFRPLVLNPHWVRPGEYEVAERVSISGAVGLAVSTYDKDSNSANLFGVYRLQLFVDDVPRFQYRFDDLSFKDNPMIELERDYRLTQRNYGTFHKLYKDNRNTRDGYVPNRPWAGVLKSESLSAKPRLRSKSGGNVADIGFDVGSLFPGKHDFRIEVADFLGNVSVVTGRFEVGAAYKIQPLITQDESGQHILQDVMTFDLRRIDRVEQYVLSGNRWQITNPNIRPLEEKGGEGEETEISEESPSLMQPLSVSGISKFVGYDQFDIPSHPFFYFPPRSSGAAFSPQLSVDYDYYDDYLRLQITSKNLLGEIPSVILYPGRRDSLLVDLHQIDLREYVGRINFSRLAGNYHLLKILARSLGGEEKISWFQFLATEIDPPGKDRLVSDDQNCWVNFLNNSLYNSIYARIEIDSLNHFREPGVIGRIYTVQPTDALLKDGAYVHLRYPAGEFPVEKLGVYYKTNRGRWVFIDNDHDANRGSIYARVLSFEKFALMVDEEAPEITAIRPGYHARLKNPRPLISASVLDHKSGFRNEDDIELRLDGVKLIAEYDPERNRIFYQIKEPLSRGRHEILVWARDRARNFATQSAIFWID